MTSQTGREKRSLNHFGNHLPNAFFDRFTILPRTAPRDRPYISRCNGAALRPEFERPREPKVCARFLPNPEGILRGSQCKHPETTNDTTPDRAYPPANRPCLACNPRATSQSSAWAKLH